MSDERHSHNQRERTERCSLGEDSCLTVRPAEEENVKY